MNRAIDIIGVQMDKGAERRGVDMGPSAVRYAGLCGMLEKLGHDVNDRGDIYGRGASAPEKNSRLNNLDIVNEINGRLYAKALETLKAGRFPVVLGGDHSIALGSVAAAQRHFGKIGIIWVDAHGDFNDDSTSPSGNIHGMPLSALTGNGPAAVLPFVEKGSAFTDPCNAALVGVRSIDEQERQRIKKAGVNVFTMARIDETGMHRVISEAVGRASEGTAGVYLSFDLDAIDPVAAPGVGTPESGGLTYREAHLLCEYAASSGKLLGIDVVELNPIHDVRNQTGQIAATLISSLLCKTII